MFYNSVPLTHSYLARWNAHAALSLFVLTIPPHNDGAKFNNRGSIAAACDEAHPPVACNAIISNHQLNTYIHIQDAHSCIIIMYSIWWRAWIISYQIVAEHTTGCMAI